MAEDNRIRFHVRITPKASANKLNGWDQDADQRPILKVMVTSVPEKGKANEALIALLSKEWKIPKSNIVIEKGETDRNKVLSVPKEWANILKTGD